MNNKWWIKWMGLILGGALLTFIGETGIVVSLVRQLLERKNTYE